MPAAGSCIGTQTSNGGSGHRRERRSARRNPGTRHQPHAASVGTCQHTLASLRQHRHVAAELQQITEALLGVHQHCLVGDRPLSPRHSARAISECGGPKRDFQRHSKPSQPRSIIAQCEMAGALVEAAPRRNPASARSPGRSSPRLPRGDPEQPTPRLGRRGPRHSPAAARSPGRSLPPHRRDDPDPPTQRHGFCTPPHGPASAQSPGRSSPMLPRDGSSCRQRDAVIVVRFGETWPKCNRAGVTRQCCLGPAQVRQARRRGCCRPRRDLVAARLPDHNFPPRLRDAANPATHCRGCKKRKGWSGRNAMACSKLDNASDARPSFANVAPRFSMRRRSPAATRSRGHSSTKLRRNDPGAPMPHRGCCARRNGPACSAIARS